jgi:hypothetical protein
MSALVFSTLGAGAGSAAGAGAGSAAAGGGASAFFEQAASKDAATMPMSGNTRVLDDRSMEFLRVLADAGS